MDTIRTPTAVTISVWKALFLREAVSRLARARAAWLWLLLEPITHIVFLMFILTAVRLRAVGGIETPIWVMVGLMSFFMFRRTTLQAMNGVAPNRSLFVYRQVKPVDAVLVRATLEGFLTAIIFVILLCGAGLFGYSALPTDPLATLEALFALWLLGLGLGLMTSVAAELVPEIGRFVLLLMTPLYFFSGVIFPLNVVPQPYRDWLMLNPVAHGVDAARTGFGEYYHQSVPDLSIGYVYGVALIMIFFGLALHNRFANRLITQ